MRQDTTAALAGLASFAKLQELLAARRHAGSVEAMMTFETFEVELGKAVRGLENELKSADLARYDVEADAVIVDGRGLDHGVGHPISFWPSPWLAAVD